MIGLGIIGLGSIFPKQLEALKLSREYYRLCAVCDSDPNKVEMFQTGFTETFEDMPRIYQNSDSLFRDPQIDSVLIATPPASHFDLARSGLRNKKHILLEKPAVMSLEELEILYQEAESNGVMLHVAYHAAFAKDLEWFVANKEDLQKKYQFGKISRIECSFYDPYMENGAVIERKRSLGGSYIDSGVNALSVCARLTSLSDFMLTEWQEQTDGITVYHGERSYQNDDCAIRIRTGWDMGRDQKTTLIEFANLDGKLLLHHSNQCVMWLQEGRENLLYQYEELPRLIAHYVGVFTDFYRAYATQAANREQSMQIHRLLFEQGKRKRDEK